MALQKGEAADPPEDCSSRVASPTIRKQSPCVHSSFTAWWHTPDRLACMATWCESRVLFKPFLLGGSTYRADERRRRWLGRRRWQQRQLAQ